METYQVYKHPEKEKPITRIVLFEKCRKHDFENNGLKYWYDKNGKTIRIDNLDCSLDMRNYLTGFKGSSYMEAGYVFTPYIPMQLEPVVQDFYPREGLVSRYETKKINTSYYGVVSL